MEPGKVFYVTKEKLKEIKKEYEDLMAFERAKTVGQEAPKMIESEDMSAEFIAYHEDMDSLRARIDELAHIIDHHQLIKNPPRDQREQVGIGATVKVDVGGKKDEFMIVGTLEANPMAGKISNESPVGKALLGHKIGDEVVVESPENPPASKQGKKLKIKGIHYQVS